MTTTNEPEVIAELRGWHREGCENLFTIGEVLAVDIHAILAAYDAIVAERDAAVRELEETRKREALSDAIVDECDSDITKLVQERATLRARLAACERVVEAAKRVIDADTDVLQAVAIVMLREAFAAETQTTTTKDTTL